MNHQYYGSSKSTFFVIVRDRQIVLRNKEMQLWETALPLQEPSYISVGNNGTVAVFGNNQCFLSKPSGGGKFEPIPLLAKENQGKTVSGIEKLRLNTEGTRLAFLKITQKSEKKFFGGVKEETDYEALFFDIGTGKVESIFKISIPREGGKKVHWNISASLEYMLFAVSGKSGEKTFYKCTFFQVPEKKTKVFEVSDTEILNSMIHGNGTLMLELEQINFNSIFTFSFSDGQTNTLIAPENARVYHLAGSFLLFESRGAEGERVFTARTFANKELVRYDMKEFHKKQVDFELLFNIRDFIELVFIWNGNFYCYSSELPTLITEIKRFALISKSKEEDEEAFTSTARPDDNADIMDYLGEHFGYSTDLSAEESEKPRDFMTTFDPLNMDMGEEEESGDPQKGAKSFLEFPGQGKKQGKKTEEAPQRLSLPSRDESSGQETTEAEKLHKLMGVTAPDKKQSAKNQEDFSPAEEPVLTEKDRERKKLERLLDSIEGRFMLGEINEESYRELKNKYNRMLQAIK